MLIILDEADRLKISTLEQVRHMYDQGGLSVILIGMPGLEKRLSRYAQLYSRIGCTHQYRSVHKKEIVSILEHHWGKLGVKLDNEAPDDIEAIAAIIRITNGNFRLINRLFSQIRRITTINSLKSITVEVVEAARDCLVIGNV